MVIFLRIIYSIILLLLIFKSYKNNKKRKCTPESRSETAQAFVWIILALIYPTVAAKLVGIGISLRLIFNVIFGVKLR
jgi:hypothetical protein